jgi:hypothetical protein
MLKEIQQDSHLQVQFAWQGTFLFNTALAVAILNDILPR